MPLKPPPQAGGGSLKATTHYAPYGCSYPFVLFESFLRQVVFFYLTAEIRRTLESGLNSGSAGHQLCIQIAFF